MAVKTLENGKPAPLPDTMSKVDILDMQLAQAREEAATIALQLAQERYNAAKANREKVAARLREQYQIEDSTPIDATTGKINRTVAPAAQKAGDA